jgi:hypothetical protein
MCFGNVNDQITARWPQERPLFPRDCGGGGSCCKDRQLPRDVGSYDPRQDRVDLKADRIKHWIAMGATVSDTLHNILISQKIIEGKKINVLPRKSPPKKEGEEAAS